MKRLTRDERLILQEAARNKRRINEGKMYLDFGGGKLHTVREVIKFLETFPDDAEVDIHIDHISHRPYLAVFDEPLDQDLLEPVYESLSKMLFERENEELVSVPTEVEELLQDLEAIPEIEHAYITDKWRDGWFNIRIALKTDGIIPFSYYSGGPMFDFYQIPNLKKTIGAIRRAVRNSDVVFESLEAPQKTYEFIPARERSTAEKRLSGYLDNEVRLEIYGL